MRIRKRLIAYGGIVGIVGDQVAWMTYINKAATTRTHLVPLINGAVTSNIIVGRLR